MSSTIKPQRAVLGESRSTRANALSTARKTNAPLKPASVVKQTLAKIESELNDKPSITKHVVEPRSARSKAAASLNENVAMPTEMTQELSRPTLAENVNPHQPQEKTANAENAEPQPLNDKPSSRKLRSNNKPKLESSSKENTTVLEPLLAKADIDSNREPICPTTPGTQRKIDEVVVSLESTFKIAQALEEAKAEPEPEPTKLVIAPKKDKASAKVAQQEHVKETTSAAPAHTVEAPLLSVVHSSAIQKPAKKERPLVPAKSGLYVVGSLDNVGFPIGEDVFESEVLTHVDSLSEELGMIAVGGQHALVVSKDGMKVWSFGQNDEGALGRDTDGDPLEEQEAKLVNLHTTSPIQQVICSDNMSAFLTEDGKVYSCGTFKNQDGENHYNEELDHQPVPSLVTGFAENVMHLAAGANFLLAVTCSGDLYAWGEGKHGQLGHATRTRAQQHTRTPYRLSVTDPETKRPTRVAFQKVFAGTDTAFAVDKNHRVFAFGSNNWGQLGLGATEPTVQVVPTLISYFTTNNIKIIKVASGNTHTLFLDDQGIVYSCGRDDEGQLGRGERPHTERFSAEPLPLVNAFEKDVRVVDIACGLDHNIAVDANENLWSWGWGEGWMLGHGRQRSERVPVKCKMLGRVDGGCEGKIVRMDGARVARAVAGGNFTCIVLP